MQKYFITGTDTGVGKTYISVLLLKQWRKHKVIALKPIASGCVRKKNKLYNEDALQLQKNASIRLPYDMINPYPLEVGIAPAFAAKEMQVHLTVQSILQRLAPALTQSIDICLIEGAGGWLVPLNDDETMADLAIALHAQVILVVGIRLGCINHALLTNAALVSANVPFYGWIANCINPHETHTDEMITCLSKRLAAPLIDVVRFNQT